MGLILWLRLRSSRLYPHSTLNVRLRLTDYHWRISRHNSYWYPNLKVNQSFISLGNWLQTVFPIFFQDHSVRYTYGWTMWIFLWTELQFSDIWYWNPFCVSKRLSVRDSNFYYYCCPFDYMYILKTLNTLYVRTMEKITSFHMYRILNGKIDKNSHFKSQ